MLVTCRQLSEAQVLHGARGDKWFLRIVQDVSKCVHANVEVGNVDAHGLFSHGRLIRVPRRLNQKQCVYSKKIFQSLVPSSTMTACLVVVGEWDDGSTDTQDHGRVDLTVSVSRAVGNTLFLEVIRSHGEHHCLLLQSVNVFNHTTRHQVLPTDTAKSETNATVPVCKFFSESKRLNNRNRLASHL